MVGKKDAKRKAGPCEKSKSKSSEEMKSTPGGSGQRTAQGTQQRPLQEQARVNPKGDVRGQSEAKVEDVKECWGALPLKGPGGLSVLLAASMSGEESSWSTEVISCAAILDLGSPFAGESVGLDLLAEPGVESMDSTKRLLARLRPVPGGRSAFLLTKRPSSSSGTSWDSS